MVTPRKFGEIDAIFSSAMTDTFSGCLVYEFSEEPNRYGLAKIDAKDGSVKQMKDYAALASKYTKLPSLPKDIPAIAQEHPRCPDETSFLAINGANKLPSLPEIAALILTGVSATPGKLRELTSIPASNHTIYDANGVEIVDKTAIVKSGVNGHLPDLRLLLKTTGYAPSLSSLSSSASASTMADTSGSSDSAAGSSSSWGVSRAALSNHVLVIMVVISVFVL